MLRAGAHANYSTETRAPAAEEALRRLRRDSGAGALLAEDGKRNEQQDGGERERHVEGACDDDRRNPTMTNAGKAIAFPRGMRTSVRRIADDFRRRCARSMAGR